MPNGAPKPSIERRINSTLTGQSSLTLRRLGRVANPQQHQGSSRDYRRALWAAAST